MKKDKAINLAIDNVIKEGLTDIFDRPFEIDFLIDEGFRKEAYNEVLTSLKDYNLSNLKVSQLEYVLMPKKEIFDFRRCALMQPIDTIKYTSLILLIADKIEKKRIAIHKNNVFSYRFNPKDGYLFDKDYTYSSFKKYIESKSKENNINVLVECDIANFYDRLNLHRLESILRSIKDIDDNIVKLINELLLFWANRDSYGLPVGGNASRILAEAALIEVDNFLISKNINFVRFVDDYRLFAPNASVANKWLSLLVEKLSQEGLFINVNKTVFKDVSQKKKNTPNEEVVSKNKKITECKENQQMRVMSSYSGVIPRKFREATEHEINGIKETVVIEDLFDKVKNEIIVKPSDFKLLIKSIIYLKQFDYLKKIPKLLKKLPQFVPYFTDVLIKYEDSISDDIAINIRDNFSKWILQDELPEYIIIYIVRLLGRERYKNIEVIFNTFVNLKRNSGSYIARVLLEQMEVNLDRGRILEIKNYYLRSTLWERRQIIRIIDKNLYEDEKRPLLKNIAISSNDLFEKGIFNKYKPPKKKK